MKKLITFFIINIFIFGLSHLSAAVDEKADDAQRAQEIEKAIFMASASQERVLRIGLVDCIAYVLKNNSEILIKRIEPRLKEDDVKIAQAVFEPTLNVDYTLRDTSSISPNSSFFSPSVSTSRATELNAGLEGKLPSGAGYSLDFLSKRYESNASYQVINPYYTTEPKITITQPLFKGSGVLINKADIIIARNNRLQSGSSFKDTVMDVISKAKIAYYNYIFYLENYAIAKLSLGRAQDLLEINKARYQKGLLSSVDLLETEAAVAQREKTLLTAEAEVKKAEDDLKLITNLVNDPEVWNAKVELIDKPEFIVEEVDLLQSLKDAFANRADYYAAKIDLQNKDIKIATAKNALYPEVDLIGSFGLNGLGKDYQDALKKVDSDYKDWSVGVKFSLPWGGADRAKYDQRKLEKAQALLLFKRLEQNIILEVRDKVRLVDTQKKQVEAAKLSKEKETQNYDAQKERYAQGEVSTHDMLDYQDRLSQAELDYVKSLIDYNIALINLDKSRGLTLAKNNIKLEE